MRISDWSSDVCSSDLQKAVGRLAFAVSSPMPEKARKGAGFERRRKHETANITKVDISYRATLAHLESMFGHDRFPARKIGRASCGKEGVSTCRSRGSPYH